MTPLPVIPENIPSELQAVRQWVTWRLENRNGTWAKVPYDPISQSKAKSDDPSTWSEFRFATERHKRGGYAGVGYMFSQEDEFCGIDLDNVRNPDTGELVNWSSAIIERCDTYCEISPSGRGVKLFGRGLLPTDKGGKVKLVDGTGLEIYDRYRYFAVTGHKLAGSPSLLANIQPVIDLLVATYFENVRQWGDIDDEHRVEIDQKLAGVDRRQLVNRCRAYVSRMPSAISGQDGSGKTFAVAAVCFRFALNTHEARQVLAEYNARCFPTWSTRELEHKLRDAERRVVNEGTFGCLI